MIGLIVSMIVAVSCVACMPKPGVITAYFGTSDGILLSTGK
jgi:hypothetical protein